MIVRFTFYDTHIDLFLARFTFPNSIQGKLYLLSLILTRFTLSSLSNNKIYIHLEYIEKAYVFTYIYIHGCAYGYARGSQLHFQGISTKNSAA